MFNLFSYALFGVGKDAGTAKGQLQMRESPQSSMWGIFSSNENGFVDRWMHLAINQSLIMELGMRMVFEPDKTPSCCRATGMTSNLEFGGGDGNPSENVIPQSLLARTITKEQGSVSKP
ncbi:hypothetical protein OIU79_015581 [Salix purpurea]|uniref:Uncharacterized protein n=1 Tax=Salix purpurea TaxID=77065 RepID=A0A9Q0PC95_SALPP|nr:hypothetical protein OIU79_015581 [Salix purpurea]